MKENVYISYVLTEVKNFGKFQRGYEFPDYRIFDDINRKCIANALGLGDAPVFLGSVHDEVNIFYYCREQCELFVNQWIREIEFKPDFDIEKNFLLTAFKVESESLLKKLYEFKNHFEKILKYRPNY